jgi:hypothetical protein
MLLPGDRRAVPANVPFTLCFGSIFYFLFAKYSTGGGDPANYTGCLMFGLALHPGRVAAKSRK